MAGQFDEFKTTFFDECDEHLETLAEEIRKLSADAHDDEQINAIFRAVHSIKGGAAAFGLDDLVIFTHDFETALDKIRQKTSPLTEDAVNLFARSSDALFDIKSEVQKGTPNSLEMRKEIHDAIKRFSMTEAYPKSLDDKLKKQGTETYDDRSKVADGETSHIVLRTSKDFFEMLYDPIRAFKDMRQDIEARVESVIDEFPNWSSYSPVTPVAHWKIITKTELTEKAEEYFEVCEDFITLSIEPISTKTKPVKDGKTSASKPTTDTKSKGTIRVTVEKVDRLMNLVGELVINNSVLTELVNENNQSHNHELVSGLEEFQQLTRNIQESVMTIRAQPLKSLFLRLSKVARETAEELGKKIEFNYDGESTELDSNTIARLLDPLTHLVRNAIDHGIEDGQQRAAKGKKETGTITVSAHQASGHAHILIQDDGSGLDAIGIKRKAIEKGIIETDRDLTASQTYRMIFAPGFSTSKNITDVSGRGVGLNIVEREVASLGGKIDLTPSNSGTTFHISLPLTLAVLEGMIVRTNNHTIVLPLQSVSETMIVESRTIRRVDPHTEVIQVRNDTLPIVRMDSVMSKSTDLSSIENKIAVIVGKGQRDKTALIIDEIVDQRQVVVKSLARGVSSFTFVNSATILGDGNIALILEPTEINRFVDESKRSRNSGHLDNELLSLLHA